MKSYLSNLPPDMLRSLKDAISLITILIAGSDGKIDHEETAWAEKLTRIRSYSSPEKISDFYAEVGKDFSERLTHYIEALPDDRDERNKDISDRLSSLNGIFAKLDQEKAHHFYLSMTSFAKHVAKASGGFLGFGSISSAEKKWIGLPMIDPIDDHEEVVE